MLQSLKDSTDFGSSKHSSLGRQQKVKNPTAVEAPSPMPLPTERYRNYTHSMTLLALVRHGQTDWNAERRMQGRTDIPLNDRGRAQAVLAAANLCDGRWGRVVSSPMSRARETAEIIASELSLEQPVVYPGLVERDYGVAEGTPVAEFHTRYGSGNPVPDAETINQLIDRVMKTLVSVVEKQPRVPTIVVAHGGIIRELVTQVSAGFLPRPGQRIENGSVTQFELTNSGLSLTNIDPASAISGPDSKTTSNLV